MSERLDAALAALDVGLQDSHESHVYSDVAPVMADVCVRCQTRDRFEDSDWCEPCRAYLLGDGPDPMGTRGIPARMPYPPRHACLTCAGDPSNLGADEWICPGCGTEYIAAQWRTVGAPRGGIRYVPPPDPAQLTFPEWDRDVRMGIARTELTEWVDVVRYVNQLRREENLPVSLPLRVTIEPRDHLGVTLSVGWSSHRIMWAAIVDALTPITEWLGERIRDFVAWGHDVGMIGDDGNLTEPYRDILLQRDLATFGEAFVDADGHRVDPATVRTRAIVPDDTWNAWRNGTASDGPIPMEFDSVDADGNMVERWAPPPSGDPRTDPVAYARAYRNGHTHLSWDDDGTTDYPDPHDHVPALCGDPIAAIGGTPVFAPFDGFVSYGAEGDVSVTDNDGRTARFFHCDEVPSDGYARQRIQSDG